MRENQTDDPGSYRRSTSAGCGGSGPPASRCLPVVRHLDPERWLARLATGELVPDDLSALLDDSLGEAPHEASADERRAEDDGGDEG